MKFNTWRSALKVVRFSFKSQLVQYKLYITSATETALLHNLTMKQTSEMASLTSQLASYALQREVTAGLWMDGHLWPTSHYSDIRQMLMLR